MKAIVQPTYGSPDDLQLRDIDQPTIGDHDVLVRVHAASVNTADRLILRGRPYLMRAAGSGVGFSPRRPQFAVAGTDLAGRVAAVGISSAASRAAGSILPFSTSLSSNFRIAPWPLASIPASTSRTMVGNPAVAATWAIPLPIWPQPRTPTRVMSTSITAATSGSSSADRVFFFCVPDS